MPGPRLRDAFGSQDERAFLRRVFMLPALGYPLWHLAAPSDAVDPWPVWWLVAGCFLGVGLLSLRFSAVDRHLLDAFNVCSALVTLQLYLLASANAMHPFYAVGSVMSVLAALFSIRSLRNLVAYAAFLLALSVALFVDEPDVLKIAYWGGTFPVVAAAHLRLSVQQEAARATQEHQDELERSVAERTAALSDALRRLREEMEERERLQKELLFSKKLEAMGRLAGGVAHEFNNLLTTIAVYADLLRNALPEGSPLRLDVEQIKKAWRQASSLAEQMLAFSRKREGETQVLDLAHLVDGTSKVLRHLIGGDTDLVFRHEGARPTVRANPDQVEQVLVNLALNARDAMPTGGTVRIELRVLPRDEVPANDHGPDDTAEHFVLLAVSDTGLGMDPETLDRAFDPFFTRKQVNEGTGLGLSLVYGVVKQAGGHVRLLSEPGRGTRVELYWPRAEEPATVPGIEPTEGSVRGGRERILLVEDDTELRRSLERVLCGLGYRVVSADSAESALEQARLHEFDLVVSDVVMPRVSGLELIERLAAIQPLPVLLVSGQLNHPSLRDQALPPGIRLLAKPFSLDELTSEVREALGRAAEERR